MAEEENEHANKFMKYQNQRGGTIVLLDVKVSWILHFFLYYNDHLFCEIIETNTTKFWFSS
jgi:hypothetical protein